MTCINGAPYDETLLKYRYLIRTALEPLPLGAVTALSYGTEALHHRLLHIRFYVAKPHNSNILLPVGFAKISLMIL